MLVCQHAADLQALCREGAEGCLAEEKVISCMADSSVQEFAPAQLVLLTLNVLLCTLDPEKDDETVADGLKPGKWLLVRAGNAVGLL